MEVLGSLKLMSLFGYETNIVAFTEHLSHFLPLTGFVSEWGALFYWAVAGTKRVARSARGHVQQLQPYLYNLIRDY